jgi:DNA-binding IclR family transcriptional regulator
MTKSTPKAVAPSRRSGVQSIDVGFRLLDVLASHFGPMHLREIAAAAGMAPSKAHRYLTSLQRVGLAEQDPISGRYDLGAMSLRIGLAALNRRKAIQYATQAAIEFNQMEDLTVALTIWGERGPTIVGWYDSSRILICNLNAGSILPLLRSAAGQIFLAYLPRETTRTILEQEMNLIATYLPHGSFKSKSEIDGVVQRVREGRLGFTNEDLMPGLSALAAPVFDHLGRIVASISLIGPSGLVHASGSNSVALKLQGAADAVSLRLGLDPSQLGVSFIEKLGRGEYASKGDSALPVSDPVSGAARQTSAQDAGTDAKPGRKRTARKVPAAATAVATAANVRRK